MSAGTVFGVTFSTMVKKGRSRIVVESDGEWWSEGWAYSKPTALTPDNVIETRTPSGEHDRIDRTISDLLDDRTASPPCAVLLLCVRTCVLQDEYVKLLNVGRPTVVMFWNPNDRTRLRPLCRRSGQPLDRHSDPLSILTSLLPYSFIWETWISRW